MKYLFGTKDLFSLATDKLENNLLGLFEACPTLVVSAEKADFLRIVNASTSAVKATGYTKN